MGQKQYLHIKKDNDIAFLVWGVRRTLMDNSSPMPGRRASADGIWSSRAHGSRHDLSEGAVFGWGCCEM